MRRRIQVIDTHTGGEPTRVVFDLDLNLGDGGIAERRDSFRQSFDKLRSAIVCEPRGTDVMVGALVTTADTEDSSAGIIFFNNVGFLGMCGHGTIGVAIALQHLGRLALGTHRFDTPVGSVHIDLLDADRVRVRNVASYRARKGVQLTLPNGLRILGDVAWGGNWFFICQDHGLLIDLGNVTELERFSVMVRQELSRQGITGDDGQEIDHIELVGPPSHPTAADARNFVLCPGGAYDRSACGTGTSAKVACLAADGLLQPGQIHRQESVIGSLFEATYEIQGDQIIPTICGSAFVTAESTLILDDTDPFCMGIR